MATGHMQPGSLRHAANPNPSFTGNFLSPGQDFSTVASSARHHGARSCPDVATRPSPFDSACNRVLAACHDRSGDSGVHGIRRQRGSWHHSRASLRPRSRRHARPEERRPPVSSGCHCPQRAPDRAPPFLPAAAPAAGPATARRACGMIPSSDDSLLA